MSRLLAQRLCLSMTALLSGLVQAPAGELEVRLNDGSTRTGVAHRTSNASRLRIRYGTADAYIIYGITWDRIREIRDGEKIWKSEQFAEFRKAIAAQQHTAKGLITSSVLATGSSAPSDPPASKKATQQPSESARGAGDRTQTGAEPNPTKTATHRSNHSKMPRRIHYIEFDALAGNWDQDVEWDGIILRLRPTDSSGELARVSGTLTVTLFGSLDKSQLRVAFADQGEPVQRIGRWVRRLNRRDYGPSGAVYRLEFQNFQPERRFAPWHRDLALAPHGDIHLELIVPGHGVYRASTQFPVRLRRFSGLRDQQYLRHGTRFFPSE